MSYLEWPQNHTPGPWTWVTTDRGARLTAGGVKGLYVLDAVRKGMQDATVRFRTRDNLEIMVPADQIPPEYNKANHSVGLRHPDAQLLQAAPEMYQALVDAYRAFQELPDGLSEAMPVSLIAALRSALGVNRPGEKR